MSPQDIVIVVVCGVVAVGGIITLIVRAKARKRNR